MYLNPSVYMFFTIELQSFLSRSSLSHDAILYTRRTDNRQRTQRDPYGTKKEKLEAVGWRGEGRRLEGRERAGCRKLEGRRSRPGLVLGLADSLALSRRNASNAGEPLLSLSFFNTPASSSVRLSRRLPFFFPRILRGFILLSPSLFRQAPFHSVHSLLR